MTQVVIGIDPGLTGAVVSIRNHIPEKFVDMPVRQASGFVKNKVDAVGLDTALREMTYGEDRNDVLVVIEHVTSIGGRERGGASIVWSLAYTTGVIESVVALCGFTYHLVRPQVWKRAFLLGREKDESRDMALRLYGAEERVKRSLARKKDHNRAEALLLARYGWVHLT